MWSYAGQKRWGRWEASQSQIPEDREAKSSALHSNFLCSRAELPRGGTDDTHAGYVKRKQDCFPEREPSWGSKQNWHGGSLLTLRAELKAASGREASAGKAVCSLQGQATGPRQWGAGGAGQGCRCGGIHPQGLPGLHIAHSRSREAGDLLQKQPEAACVSNSSVHYKKARKPCFEESSPQNLRSQQERESSTGLLTVTPKALVCAVPSPMRRTSWDRKGDKGKSCCQKWVALRPEGKRSAFWVCPHPPEPSSQSPSSAPPDTESTGANSSASSLCFLNVFKEKNMQHNYRLWPQMTLTLTKVPKTHCGKNSCPVSAH